MENKILGLDLGTNSIGISVRNADKQGPVIEQLEYFSSVIFKSGVGKDKSGEFSYAAERTTHRSSRRLYMSRKYRIWRTLEVLIAHGYCPMTMEELDHWRKYDKAKGLKREYPIDAVRFEQWVRLDFDGDGKPEYESPYELRAELMNRQFDFEQEEERYKLGRALYHIAQRRGFKSSKGDSAAMPEDESAETDVLKKSEEERSKDLVAYMEEHNCPTVGCAFRQMELDGKRVRKDNLSMVVRAQYEEEIKKIFAYQHGLSVDSDFYTQIMSRKKGEGSIFYKRPLRSQKGSVGKCTLEPQKARCPISRPEFELYRAWSLINNIRYATKEDGEVKPQRELSLEVRQALFESQFTMARKSMKFSDLTKWLKKNTGIEAAKWNYRDDTTVMGCPVVYRLQKLLGEDWMTARLNGRYTYEDLWHVCFVADDNEELKEFVDNKLDGDKEVLSLLNRLFGAMQQGYADLSLKAINNILYFLQKGYIYSDAVMLAKVPSLFGSNWTEVEEALLNEWPTIKQANGEKRIVLKVANQLISEYKMLEPEDQFAFHNTEYKLEASDLKAVEKACIGVLSYNQWKMLSAEEREQLKERVADAYQLFFSSEKRDYCHIPHLTDALAELMLDSFGDYLKEGVEAKLRNRENNPLYHPSAIAIYPGVREQRFEQNGVLVSKKLLGSPATNVFRNPMVMRVLHTLRKKLNELIKAGIIDENDTRVVVETAREFNDANMRAAIESYQRDREKENQAYRKELQEYLDDSKITEADVEKVRLWHEQGKRCIYTGKTIEFGQLLKADQFEVEHTIPRSLSFDDSLANKTLCDYYYNRHEKQTKLPTELKEYEAILERIEPWIKKRDELAKQISFRRNKAKTAATKEAKDKIIRERHKLEMEHAYWADKVGRFLMKRESLNLGFRNNQLNDTRIITKYAYHYLRSVFNNVTVQRGDMTAGFRKAFGIQSIEEKKDRSNHAHHAIDATMLTLIPTNQKRDRILELFYQKEQTERYGSEVDMAGEKELASLLRSCNISGVKDVPEYIEEHILVEHNGRNQALTPSSRRVRARGKVVVNKQTGEPMYQRGDSLRGQLHKETWFGAIAPAKLDNQGKMQYDENGRILKDTENLQFVVRTELKYKASAVEPGFTKWEEVEKAIVDKKLYAKMRGQFAEGTSFKDACEQGIYMLDAHGNKVNKIRHIRCYAPGNVTNPPSVKQQTYRSKYDYKNNYYASSGDIYAMAQYVNELDGKKEYRVYSLLSVAENRKMGMEDLLPSITDKKGQKYNLHAVLKPGNMILLYETSPDELTGADRETLNKRLYVINNFETDGLRITIKHNTCAKQDMELGKGESVKDIEALPLKIRCGIRSLHFLIEGVDFRLTPNGIEFT